MNINEILQRPVNHASSRYGAQMGRRNRIADDFDETHKLYLQHVEFEDDCYDHGGAYWGLPADLWCAFTDEDLSTCIFARAKNHEEAQAKIQEECRAIGQAVRIVWT